MFEFVGRVPELFANGFRQIMRRGDARNGVVKADAPLLLLSSCRAVVGTVLRVGTRHGTVAAAAEVLFLLWRINLHLELREHFFVGRVLFLNHRNAHQAPAAATTRAAHATATSLAGFFLIILILIIIVVVAMIIIVLDDDGFIALAMLLIIVQTLSPPPPDLFHLFQHVQNGIGGMTLQGNAIARLLRHASQPLPTLFVVPHRIKHVTAVAAK
mmetsp:Transcript_12469/g.27471  ORF Transcript_12469/g.27471 Transcript_12469/m.27471 type:complete len:214 (-) Transcript_12469:824-1465(-)